MALRAYDLGGGYTAEQFQDDLNSVWADLQRELRQNGRAAEMLRARGIPPEDLLGRDVTELVDVTPSRRSGLTGLEQVVVDLTVAIALKLFDAYVLPELRRGKDREAIQPAELPEPPSAQSKSDDQGTGLDSGNTPA